MMMAGVLLMAQIGVRKAASCDPASRRRATAWDVSASENYAGYQLYFATIELLTYSFID
jgi:hypothetical protein